MKTVVVTPAGRRRYMRLLVPQLLSSPNVDRYDIWVNTTDAGDLAFLNEIGRHPKVRLIGQPDGLVNGTASIGAFFRHACDDDSLYIRFDDDIVWMESDAIAKLSKFRKENPDYFLISPMVVNNAICTSILQKRGQLAELPKVSPYCLDERGWLDPEFAVSLHKKFLSCLSDGEISEFKTSNTQIAFGRFSINCISWLGKDLGKYQGIVQGDDEEAMSVNFPLFENRTNSFVGDVTVSHFAFFTQRQLVDTSGLLDAYYNLFQMMNWIDPEIRKFVENAYQSVEQNYHESPIDKGKDIKIMNFLDTPRSVPSLKIRFKKVTLRKYVDRFKSLTSKILN